MSQEQLPQQEGVHRTGNLYAVYLYLSGEHADEDVAAYNRQQEKTHLAEGLEIQQRSPRYLLYADGEVRGFGGKPLNDANKAGYRQAQKQFLKGDVAAGDLARRRGHDVGIGDRQNLLMAEGQVGDGFFASSPYAEEWDEPTAARLGMWPKYRRSYTWFFRKVSESELECVDLSIDQSDVETYKKTLNSYGREVPEDTDSHDIPGYFQYFHADDEQQRDEFIDDFINRYRQLSGTPIFQAAADSLESLEFIESRAGHLLDLNVRVHRSVADSLEAGRLVGLARTSVELALRQLNCLAPDERDDLTTLLHANDLSYSHRPALETLLTAQRYGIWQAVSDMAKIDRSPDILPMWLAASRMSRIQEEMLLQEIYGNTNKAAKNFEVMPGCNGGDGFLKQAENAVKESIFEGDKDEMGSLTFECTKGHKNRRPAHGKIKSCWVPGCENSVACQPQLEKPKRHTEEAPSRFFARTAILQTEEKQMDQPKVVSFEEAYAAKAAKLARTGAKAVQVVSVAA